MRSAPLLALIGAATLVGVAPAQADSGSTTTPNDGGSISATIEKFGQSICPSLVKPGSSLATTLSELPRVETARPVLIRF